MLFFYQNFNKASLFFLLLIPFSLFCQNWKSIVYSYGTNQNYGVSIDIHQSKQYFTGSFKDELSIGFNSISSIENDDIFIGKSDLNGYTEWIKPIKGTSINRPNKIKANKDKFYLSGIFLDSLFIGEDTLINRFQKAGFLAYFDTSGNYINSFYPEAYNIEFEDFQIDNEGQIIITGQFYQFLNHDSFSINTSSGLNFFLLKYNPNTNKILWGKYANGSSSIGKSIYIDDDNNIYVTGSYNDQTKFEDTVLTSLNGYHNLFLAKYDSNGNKIWIRTIEGSYEVHGYGITSDTFGNTFVVGEFEGNVSIQSKNLTSSGLTDILIAKFDSNGILLWAENAGGEESDIGYDIEIDTNDDVLVLTNTSIGAKYRDIDIGISGFYEPVILKLQNYSGDLIWSKSLNSSSVSGIVNCNDFAIEDSIIGITGTNRSSIIFNGNIIEAYNNKDFYSAILVNSSNHFLGLNDNSSEYISLYPNPCKDYFRIKGNTSSELSIFDSQGREVISIKNYKFNTPINTLSLDNGIYFVKYSLLNKSYIKKLLVNHF